MAEVHGDVFGVDEADRVGLIRQVSRTAVACLRSPRVPGIRRCLGRGPLEGIDCATRLFPALDALQLVERDFVRVPPTGGPSYSGGRSYVRARADIAASP